MVYLGKINGPKMSDILSRYYDEILKSTRSSGNGTLNIRSETIDNLLFIEIEEEEENIVVAVQIPTGYVQDKKELFYSRYDSKTNSGLNLFYKLTRFERLRLGLFFKREKIKILSPEDARRDIEHHRQMIGRGDF